MKLSQDYRTGFTNNLLLFLLVLATSQGRFPDAVAVKVDFWRAEKQIYFVV